MNNGLAAKKVIKSDLTIEEFIEYIEIVIWDYGIDKFKITEVFPKRGEYVYLLRGLHMDLDDDYVCCKDRKGILLKNRCALLSFLKDSVKPQKIIIDDIIFGELYFESGYIRIEAA
jgi:hypothetical protein